MGVNALALVPSRTDQGGVRPACQAGPTRIAIEAAGRSEKDFVNWPHAYETWVVGMELRHLRYFIAVADAGSLTVAAEQKLHTSQPSLSRQIRHFQREVGVQLIHRSAHGAELTSAGKAFLDHEPMALVQAEAAKEAALGAAEPAKPTFALGFMSGAEIGLLPEVDRVLREPYVSQEEVLFQSRRVITAEGITPGLGFQVATPTAIRDKRPELEDFVRRLTAARAWSQTNVSAYAETWGKLMSIPPAVPLNWLSRAKIRVTPIDDAVVADEQQTIDLYFRSGLIKQKLNAAEIVDRSFSGAIGKGAGL